MASSEYSISVTVNIPKHEIYSLLNRAGELPIDAQPLEAYSMFAKYYTQLQAWNRAYENFMAAKSQSLSGRELRGAAILKIHATTVRIMAESSPSVDDPRNIGAAINDFATFEPFTTDFRVVVALSKSVIAAAEQDVKLGKPALNFSTDMGLVGPLYYTCCRCRDFPLRREALGLLARCPRREGMWDSEVGVRMIKEFWAIEERHEAFQRHSADEDGFVIPLCEVVDLVFTEGMQWEWIWKNPLDGRSRESSADIASASCTNGWMDMAGRKRGFNSLRKEKLRGTSTAHSDYFFKHDKNSSPSP